MSVLVCIVPATGDHARQQIYLLGTPVAFTTKCFEMIHIGLYENESYNQTHIPVNRCIC